MKPAIPFGFAILLACGMLSAACDDADNAAATSPTAFTNGLDIVGIVPSPLGRDDAFARCPSVSPFPVPFVLNITAGTSPLTLAEVRIQPTNPFGRTSPPTIFDSASLTRRFGDVTVTSFGVRQFPFTHDFTCDMRGGMLGVLVTTRDRAGAGRTSRLQVPVY